MVQKINNKLNYILNVSVAYQNFLHSLALILLVVFKKSHLFTD